MGKHSLSATDHQLVKQNKPGLPHVDIFGSAALGQEKTLSTTQAGPRSESNHDCHPISPSPLAFALTLPKLLLGKEAWGWGTVLIPPISGESFEEKR